MAAKSTSSDLSRELRFLLRRLEEDDAAQLRAIRLAAHWVIDSTLNRIITPKAANRRFSYLGSSDLLSPERAGIMDLAFGSVEQRISKALSRCGELLQAMDPAEIVVYIDEIHKLGLEHENIRCAERILMRPEAPPAPRPVKTMLLGYIINGKFIQVDGDEGSKKQLSSKQNKRRSL